MFSPKAIFENMYGLKTVGSATECFRQKQILSIEQFLSTKIFLPLNTSNFEGRIICFTNAITKMQLVQKGYDVCYYITLYFMWNWDHSGELPNGAPKNQQKLKVSVILAIVPFLRNLYS